MTISEAHPTNDWYPLTIVVRGVDLSCEAETCCARRRLVVGIPLVGNWSEMQPTSQRLDVLPVWVLTRVFSPPCPESLP
jgi:hypothetical protein